MLFSSKNVFLGRCNSANGKARKIGGSKSGCDVAETAAICQPGNSEKFGLASLQEAEGLYSEIEIRPISVYCRILETKTLRTFFMRRLG